MICDIFTILPLMACLFWTAVLLLSWKRNSAAQHLLTLFMGVSLMLYLCHFIFFNHHGPIATIADCVYTFCNLAVFPLYYIYICRLTSTHPITAKQWMLLLPAVVICIWTIAHYAFLPHCTFCGYLRPLVWKTAFALEAVAVVVMGNRKLRAFDNRLKDYYSNIEDRSLKQTENMMIVLLFGTIVSMAASYIGREYFSQNNMLLGIPSVLFTLLLFAVGYVGMMQRFCADDLEREIKENDSAPIEYISMVIDAKEAPLPPGAEDDVNESLLLAKLNALMEEEKPYLQPDLRLVDLAKRLGVGRTLLSTIINRDGGKSFSDYINDHRVRHAQQMLGSGNDYTIIAIGESSGFSSENSFYRAFRKHTGLTPGQWKKRTHQILNHRKTYHSKEV